MRKIAFLILIFIFARPFQLSTALTPQIILSHYQITINIVEGQKGPAMAEIPVRVLVKSDIANWTVHYHATPLVNETGTVLPPSQLLMQTPYTKNFDSLDVPRLVGKGTSPTGVKPLEIGNIIIGFNATGFEKPGIYEGQIVSPDGGPTIFVRVIIQPMPLELEKPFIGHKLFPKKDYVRVSPDKIKFLITGPGEYPADNPIEITVIGKRDFVLKIHATPLFGEKGSITPDRLFVNPGNGNYYSMDKPIIIMTGREKHIGKKGRVTAELYFKLRTTAEDRAGEYKGEIVITYEPDMGGGGYEDIF